VNIPESPAARHRAVTARLSAIAAEEGRLHEHERQRQEHLRKTAPAVQDAIRAVRDAEQQLERARSEHGAHGLSDMATITRQGRLARERDELQDELDDLSPWAPPAAGQGASA